MHTHHEEPASVASRREQCGEQIQMEMKRSLTRLEPSRILDVGTGYGMNVVFLARRFGKVARIWSVDPSHQVLQEVRHTLRDKQFAKMLIFKQAKAESLPFKAHHFDLVVSMLSLHHLSNPAKGLREMARVLSRDGKLIVADWRPIKSPVIPHSSKDIPSPGLVTRVLRRLGYSTILHQGRYWYLVEATR